jgi:hypothetical protein
MSVKYYSLPIRKELLNAKTERKGCFKGYIACLTVCVCVCEREREIQRDFLLGLDVTAYILAGNGERKVLDCPRVVCRVI